MKKDDMLRIFLGVVAFGCIWGFLEALTFGGLLHSYWGVLFPYHLCPCFIMAAIFGSLVMGAALAIYRKPGMLLGIGLVAALFCWLAVPFLPVSVRSTTYGPVVASATAAITASLAFGVVASSLWKKPGRSIPLRSLTGALSAILAATLFILVTSYWLDKPICADLGYARPLPDFLGIGGMVWMVAAATLFPAGYSVGAKLRSWSSLRLIERPSLSYAASATAIVLCCGIGAAAFMVGL